MDFDGDEKMFTCEKVNHVHLKRKISQEGEQSQKIWFQEFKMAVSVVSRRV